MTYTCPKDPTHLSDDPDYCSVCGAKIAGSAAPAVSSPATPSSAAALALGASGALAASGTACPDCGTLRVGGARFCEVCRHDFGAGPAGNAPASPQPATTPTRRDLSPALAPDPTPDAVSIPDLVPAGDPAPVFASRLEIVSVVDPSLYMDPDPSMVLPVDEPPRTFPLDMAENLIGRRSDKRDIHPEVPLTDPGVSHRHAKLLREPDGSFVLLDVGSANGTQLNGKDVPAGVRTPVVSGDEITLGLLDSNYAPGYGGAAMSVMTQSPRLVPAPTLPPWSTPRLLRAAFISAVLAALLLFLAVFVGTRQHYSAVKTVGKDSAPSIVAAEGIKAALADMDANVANELIAKPGQYQESTQNYEKRRKELSLSLIAAAENITYGDSERVPIQTITYNLGTYEALVAQARLLHGRGGDAAVLTTYRQANTLMQGTILPAADALDKANDDVLEQTYAPKRRSPALPRLSSGAAGLLLMGVLLTVQVFLSRRTHRV